MSLDEPQFSRPTPVSRSIAAGTTILAAVLWGLAVALPVWETLSQHTAEWDVVRGVIPAVLGWLGIVVLCPAWFANLLLLPLGFTLFKARRIGFWLSVAAFAIAAYMLPGLYGDNDEAVIVVRRIGFYLWLASFWIFALGHLLIGRRTNSTMNLVYLATLALMIVAVFGLEFAFPVSLSPLEATIKYPDDLTLLANTLASHPRQVDKDKTLHWVLVQEIHASTAKSAFPRLQQLIAAGANVNQSDRGDTPLMQTVMSRRDPMVSLFVQSGANVNARDSRGKSVLDIAHEVGASPQCIQTLIDAGAK